MHLLRRFRSETADFRGPNFPRITPERWINDFDGLGIKDEAVPLIMKGTAERVLRL